MRNHAPLIILVVALLIFPPVILTDDTSGRVSEGPMLDSIIPNGSSEGFSIRNNGYWNVDMKGWYVTDGEGTVKFTKSFIIPPQTAVFILSSTAEDWLLLDSYVVMGTYGVVNNKFSLNDSGDDIYLYDKDGNLRDSFVYGNVFDYHDWQNDPFPSIPKKKIAFRNHSYENGSDDAEWRISVPGRTLYHFLRTYDATVTPFSFPESNGEPIIECLQNAESSVRISVYEIHNEKVSSVLKYLLEKGVNIRILVEGSPAGGISTEELRSLAALTSLGADVNMIKSNDSYKRYTYLHNKYAIVDEKYTIITSENWTDSSFSSNRGWGTIIESVECAKYLALFFDNDSDEKMIDIMDFKKLYPTAIPCIIKNHVPVEYDYPIYQCQISPVIAPDYSRKQLMDFIDASTERFYSEQLNVEYDWVDGGRNPLSAMESLNSNGVDCKLLVDVTYDSPYDTNWKDGYGLYAKYSSLGNLKMRYIVSDKFGLSHNKGMISDDRVWIGSMNWTDNSIDNNREISVIIRSKEISNYYASLFMDDWGSDFDGELKLEVSLSNVSWGTYAEMDASGSSVPFGTQFSWDIDGDGEADKNGTKTTHRFFKNTECTLIALCPDGKEFRMSFSATIDDSENKNETRKQPNEEKEENPLGSFKGPMKYVPLVALVGIIILMKALKVAKR